MSSSSATATSCPVPLELLALMLRCDAPLLHATIGELPEAPRAALALYCFERYHMRRLGFAIALHCSEGSLEAAAGAAGRQLHELARNAAAGADRKASSPERLATRARAAA